MLNCFSIFTSLSGLKINFAQSEVVVINDDNWDYIYADLFNCQIGNFPLKYLWGGGGGGGWPP
jgi:hypothetical protein